MVLLEPTDDLRPILALVRFAAFTGTTGNADPLRVGGEQRLERSEVASAVGGERIPDPLRPVDHAVWMMADIDCSPQELFGKTHATLTS